MFADEEVLKREEERLLRHMDSRKRPAVVSKSPSTPRSPASSPRQTSPESPVPKSPVAAHAHVAPTQNSWQATAVPQEKSLEAMLTELAPSPGQPAPPPVPRSPPPAIPHMVAPAIPSTAPPAVPLESAGAPQEGAPECSAEEEGAYCWYCDRPVTGRHYDCQDRVFHVECMLCRSCARPLERYCQHDDELYCPECFRSMFVKLPRCSACGTDIPGASVIGIGGATLHPDCFRCAHCGGAIVNEYVEFEGKAYCSPEVSPCYKLARGSVCCSCSKPLQQNYLKVLGRMYHKDGCFKCAGCAAPFTGLEFYPIDNKPYCEACATRIVEHVPS